MLCDVGRCENEATMAVRFHGVESKRRWYYCDEHDARGEKVGYYEPWDITRRRHPWDADGRPVPLIERLPPDF